MRKKPKNAPLFCLALAVLAGGCAWTAPYVYDPQEFNRGAVDFGKEIEDRNAVSICYNNRATTPREILELAQTECGKFRKVARFDAQERLECPVFTPVLAHFDCVTPK